MGVREATNNGQGELKAGDAAMAAILQQRIDKAIEQHNALLGTERDLEVQLREVQRQRHHVAGRVQELQELMNVTAQQETGEVT